MRRVFEAFVGPSVSAAGVDLSIVVEMTTGDITGACDARSHLVAWARDAQAAKRSFEILLVAPTPLQGLETLDLGAGLRRLEVPGAGYYALKNAGANAATGRVVLFTDADCRPVSGYVAGLFSAFDDPAVVCVAGRSLYDGDGLLTRINSALSFGDVHCGQEHFDRGRMFYAHHVAALRAALTHDPFGPFQARVGGDRYMTDAMRRGGRRVLLLDELVVRHEDPTYSLRGTLERHLRECIMPLGYGTERQRFSLWFTLACTLALRPGLRVLRLVRAGRRLGIRPLDYPTALALNLAYWAFDLGCVGAVLLVPPLRRRWLRFNFGPAAA